MFVMEKLFIMLCLLSVMKEEVLFMNYTFWLLSFQYVYFLLVFICMYILCNIIYSFILNHGRYAKIEQRSSALGDTTDLNYI